MKHTIDVLNYQDSLVNPNTYTRLILNEPEKNTGIINTKGIFQTISLTELDVEKFINEKKVYYAHTYDSINMNNTDESIYALIFIYEPVNNKYNIGTYFLNQFNTCFDKKLPIDFINLTNRVNVQRMYWIPIYCQHVYERFHNYQTTLLDFFDSPDEARRDLYEYMLTRDKYLIGTYKSTVMKMNNTVSYNQMFDDMFQERTKNIKEEIEKELEEKKNHAEAEIKKLSLTINTYQEYLNKL